MNEQIILEIKNLKTYFYTYEGIAKAVDGISYQLAKGEPLGVVGESGCGKSVTALSILRLVPAPPGKIVGGEILFKGENLLDLTEDRMRKVRGNQISMIFQEPMTSRIRFLRWGTRFRRPSNCTRDYPKKMRLERASRC